MSGEAPVRASSTLGGKRPMRAADLPIVGRHFLRIFRGIDKEAGPELRDYLDALVFGSPCYDLASGSCVFAQADGSISSTILTIPMTFMACDRRVTGRLLCVFMTQNVHTSGGAVVLGLTMRARLQPFAFCDSASPKSFRHVRAWGGVPVPLQNLGWVRTFRPLEAAVLRVSRRLLGGRGRGFARLAGPLDDLLRARRPRIKAPLPKVGVRVEPMAVERFLDEAPGFVARYAVRPLWSREELGWLLDMARRNRVHGPLAIMAVTDKSGRRIGCYVYYGAGMRIAHVLNVLADKGREVDVLGAMFHTFDQQGFVEARGRAQPALAEGLALQPMLTLRHEAFAAIVSCYPDVVEAVRRGDVYIGGLAGEGWSRLMSDFR